MKLSVQPFAISMRTKFAFRISIYSLLSVFALFAYIFRYKSWLFPTPEVVRLESFGTAFFFVSGFFGIGAFISLMADNAKCAGRPWWMQ